MNYLIVQENISKSLSSELIKNSTPELLVNELKKLIFKSFVEAGQKTDEEFIKITALKLSEDCFALWFLVRIEELSIAFNLGALGEYGKYYGLNKITYAKWIKGYIKSDERKNALKNKLTQSMLAEKTELSNEEKNKILLEGSLKAFEEFKQNGGLVPPVDVGNVTYDYLDNLGVIPFSTERKIKFRDQAQEILIRESKAEKFSKKDSIMRNLIDRTLKELENKKDSRIIIKAKKLALNTFFKDLIETEAELIDLINS